jgi:hypothetical protein
VVGYRGNIVSKNQLGEGSVVEYWFNNVRKTQLAQDSVKCVRISEQTSERDEQCGNIMTMWRKINDLE